MVISKNLIFKYLMAALRTGSARCKILKAFALALPFAFTACSESFTDVRDSQSYGMVQIGEQTWMAENLNFASAESACPDGDERNCKKMGRLYTWADAKSVCPEGWRLPTREDFEKLAFLAGGFPDIFAKAGAALKSTSGWFKKGNGSDNLNFKALPAGYKRLDGKFDGIGGYAYFWSKDEDSDGKAFYFVLDFSSPAAKLEAFGKGEGRSVRCVK